MVRAGQHTPTRILTVLALGFFSVPAEAVSSSVALPTVRDLAEIADIGGLRLSPDGRFVAYRIERPSIALNDTPTSWYVAPVDGSAPPRRIADGGMAIHVPESPDVEFPLWSLDGHWIYFRALIDRSVQVWRAATDGSVQQQLSHDDADVEAFELDEPRHLLLYRVGASRAAIATAEQQEYDDGVRIDASVDPAGGLVRQDVVNGRPTTVRVTGKWFHHAGLLDAEPRQLRAIDLTSLATVPPPATGGAGIEEKVSVWGEEGGHPFRIRVRSDDERGAVLVRMTGLDRSVVVTRSDGQEILCRAQACEGQPIDLVQWLPHADAVLFSTHDGWTQRLFLWDVGSPQAHAVAQASGQWSGDRMSYYPCAVGERTVACVRASAAEPPRLETIDLATGRVRVLDTPNAGLGLTDGVREEDLQWRDGSGRSFSGHIFWPANPTGKRVPLFVTYYVCPGFLRGGTGDEFPLIPLAAHGIAALCIQRTAAAPGGSDNVDQYVQALSGVEAIVDRLDALGLIDRQRIGMGGLSFGGEVTAWALMNSPLLAAASISSTLFEPTYWWFNGVAGRDIHDGVRSMWQLGAPDETPERWKQLSPAFNVDRIRAPLLMQMPEQEFRMNMELYARLTEAGRAADLYAFPQEPHVKIQPRHKLAVYQRNLDWFRYWLTGAIDPDPLKAGQYRHWQAFRNGSAPVQGDPSQSRAQISTSTSDKSRK
jgi:dipeptidyl aminopeptidase/acylaminoacyl peptidase